MKNFLSVIVLLSFIGNSAFAKRVKISVKGMVCAFCAQGITKKFKAEPAVSAVDVSLEKKSVVLNLNDGKDISDAAIEGILKDAGYNVDKIERL